ncbi:molybdopterin molybdenumtransferase MoeA [Acinetobacter sp. ANC 4633]|uniref:molybdopterin molybdotransferase MoeA n=1 Tax=Acinetobacter sp. ANC 4633 TaxID=2529845 RepID=UPI00103D93CE|nr:molybdopterin molybdotransferase MoeA [Acinetobacter sp. ANC 4633]TCB24832.1 molybdopterin molybdenumtransferase MoeA [Acinetobacter sp. ANC 4633]
MSGCGAEHGLISIDQALALIAQTVQPLGREPVSVEQALQRVLVEDVHAPVALPIFSQSAVDGYALAAAQHPIDAGQCFQVIGEVRAGQVSDVLLQAGQAVRIFTGGKIPEGTTTVARQEIVQLHVEQQIELTDDLAKHADIRDAGEEVQAGQVLATQGQRLSVGAIAALCMAGVQQVSVYRQAKIAVVVTGDEVASHVDELQQGKIFDANTPMLKAWCQQHRLDAEFFLVADQETALTELLQDLQSRFDLIITTGGVSVGDYDFVRPVALNLGFQQVFWKVKQKPGKPMFFAHSQSAERCCYLLGLPGNPAAVYVALQVYVSSVLRGLAGQSIAPAWVSAVLQHDLKPDRRERFLRMSAEIQQGQLQVTALKKQQSHMLSNLFESNFLLRVPADTVLSAGTLLNGIYLD